MTDELVKGIRRIVGDPEEKPKGLSDSELRKPIGISRGVAYIGSGGSIRGGGGEGAGNDTSPPVVPDPESDPDSPVPNADEGVTNTGGSGTGNKTVLSGDVADVDDATATGTKIEEVTGESTEPGAPNFTTVNFDTFAGIEYVPPEGWETPDSGIPYEGFVLGKTIFILEETRRNYVGDNTATTEQAGNLLAEFQNLDPNYRNYTYTSAITDPLRIVIDGEFFNFTGWNPRTLTIEYQLNDCTPTEGSISCPLAAPLKVEVHPSDGSCYVAYDHSDNGYKGHVLDPDCSDAQKTASSFTVLQSQTQPGRYFRYTKLKDGGTKITEVDSGGTPKPGTVSKIMDAAGNVNSFFDVSLDNFYQ